MWLHDVKIFFSPLLPYGSTQGSGFSFLLLQPSLSQWWLLGSPQFPGKCTEALKQGRGAGHRGKPASWASSDAPGGSHRAVGHPPCLLLLHQRTRVPDVLAIARVVQPGPLQTPTFLLPVLGRGTVRTWCARACSWLQRQSSSGCVLE